MLCWSIVWPGRPPGAEGPVSPQQEQVCYVVHGAWTPFAFDPGASIGYGKVNYTSA